MKASEAFFNVAYDLNVNRIYGNPGTTEIPLLKSIDEKKIRYILALHDGLSVGMAEGDYFFSNRIQIVNLHTIHGIGNSIAFLFSALKDKVPMIVTIGQQDRRHSFYDPLLYGPNSEVSKPVVKDVLTPSISSDVPKMLLRAWKIAKTYPYGPVALVLPMDMLDEEIETFNSFGTVEMSFGYDDEIVKKIADEINSSNNPAIVVGHEIEIFDATKELLEFAENLKAPIYKEPLCSRGILSNKNPLFVGELLPASVIINQTFANNDLILILGGSLTLYPYFPFELLKDKKVIELTYDYHEASKRIWQTYVCNVKEVLKNLTKFCKPKSFKKDEAKEMQLFTRAAAAKNRMGIEYVFYRISKYITNEAIFDESISATPALKEYLPIKAKNYYATRTGQLGWTMPASTGYSIAGGKCLAIIGDGSFNYSSQILWSASKYDTNVSFIILDNRGYAILKSYALARYPQITEADWLSPETNSEEIAKGYGIDSKSVSNPDELDNGISWALTQKGPKLLRIEIDKTIPRLF
jgi:Thiamine pyrophosphate-requiring enzymes [acetolactate synthase, pyruvate dehydrogenase (cytochrome), glyoxylate carboligase, phosphonopyruvate decarboxylase]